jgi:endonuclease YncB( thermonuclease family)
MEKLEETELLSCNKQTPKFDFTGSYLAKVVDCYDGDSIKAVFKFNGKYQLFTIRMYGYNTPELRPSLKMENRDQEIESAKKAKDALKDMILNKIVHLKCHGCGKYGRILGEIKLSQDDQESVNNKMISMGYGKEYFGGKK